MNEIPVYKSILRHWPSSSFLFLLDIKCVYIGKNGSRWASSGGGGVEWSGANGQVLEDVFFLHFIGNRWVWAIWIVPPCNRPRRWLCCCWLGRLRVCFHFPLPFRSPLGLKCRQVVLLSGILFDVRPNTQSQCFDILTLIRPKCCVFSNQTDNNAIAAAHTSANICPASKCVWFRVPRAVCIRCFEREMGGSGWCTWHISCIDHNHPTNKSQILLQKI